MDANVTLEKDHFPGILPKRRTDQVRFQCTNFRSAKHQSALRLSVLQWKHKHP